MSLLGPESIIHSLTGNNLDDSDISRTKKFSMKNDTRMTSVLSFLWKVVTDNEIVMIYSPKWKCCRFSVQLVYFGATISTLDRCKTKLARKQVRFVDHRWTYSWMCYEPTDVWVEYKREGELWFIKQREHFAEGRRTISITIQMHRRFWRIGQNHSGDFRLTVNHSSHDLLSARGESLGFQLQSHRDLICLARFRISLCLSVSRSSSISYVSGWFIRLTGCYSQSHQFTGFRSVTNIQSCLISHDIGRWQEIFSSICSVQLLLFLIYEIYYSDSSVVDQM